MLKSQKKFGFFHLKSFEVENTQCFTELSLFLPWAFHDPCGPSVAWVSSFPNSNETYVLLKDIISLKILFFLKFLSSFDCFPSKPTKLEKQSLSSGEFLLENPLKKCLSRLFPLEFSLWSLESAHKEEEPGT